MVKDMTKGSPMKLILGFAIPMLMGMLFQQFYNLVDTMIVGKTLGVDALAGRERRYYHGGKDGYIWTRKM